MTKDSSFYTRAGLPFGPEGPESPKDPKIFLDSDGRSIFLRKDLEKNLKKDPVYRYIDLGYLDDVEGGDKTLTINIPGSKNILSRFSLSGSQKQPKLEEGDFSEIAISLNYQKVTCLAIKEISATKILHLISALANIREPSSLKKIDLSQISIRNLPTDVVSIMPEVMVGIARIKSVDSLALCRISYDKKSKEKSSETTSLDGSYFEDHFPSSKSIIDVEYLPKQEGIKERSHIKLFENQMSHLEGLFEYRHDSMDEDKKRMEILRVTNLIFRHSGTMLPYNSSVSYLKEIYDGLLKSKGIACGSKFLGSTGNNFSEEDQPASYLLSKVVAGAQKEILSSRPNNRSQDDSQSLPALPGLGVATPIAEKTVSGSLSPFFRDGYL